MCFSTHALLAGPELKSKQKRPPIRTKKPDFSHIKSKISTSHEKPHKPGGGQVVIPLAVTHKRDPKRFTIPEPPKPRKMSPKSQRPWQHTKTYTPGKVSWPHRGPTLFWGSGNSGVVFLHYTLPTRCNALSAASCSARLF